jgi:hypothetical protein
MNLRNLTSQQLHNELVRKVSREREVMAEVVECIHEVDRRKLYFKYNCTNLFDYLTRELKYSAGSAQRRIDAARLLTPKLKEDLKSGAINLMQVAAIAQGLKQAKRETPGFTSTVEVKRDLLEKVKLEPAAQAQQVVAQALNLEIKTIEKKVIQRDESVRLEITLSKEEVELLKEVKDLLSHSLPGASYKEVLVEALKQLRKRKSSLKVIRRASSAKVSKDTGAEVRRSVFRKDKCCQWKFDNGKSCGSTFQLQVDHKQSRWLGGSDEQENLQILCSAHNQMKYQKEIGKHPM